MRLSGKLSRISVKLCASPDYALRLMQFRSSKDDSSRFVAEQLRYARMGLPLMVVGKTFSEPAFAVFPNSKAEQELCLVSEDLYKIQLAMASSGLPANPNGQPYVAASSEMLVQIQQTST